MKGSLPVGCVTAGAGGGRAARACWRGHSDSPRSPAAPQSPPGCPGQAPSQPPQRRPAGHSRSEMPPSARMVTHLTCQLTQHILLELPWETYTIWAPQSMIPLRVQLLHGSVHGKLELSYSAKAGNACTPGRLEGPPGEWCSCHGTAAPARCSCHQTCPLHHLRLPALCTAPRHSAGQAAGSPCSQANRTNPQQPLPSSFTHRSPMMTTPALLIPKDHCHLASLNRQQHSKAQHRIGLRVRTLCRRAARC